MEHTLAIPVPDLSPIGLFWQADWIIKGVMISLLLVSVWCWAIIFSKAVTFVRLRRWADQFEDAYWSSGSLEALYARIDEYPASPTSALFSAAMAEWLRQDRRTAPREVRDRVVQSMRSVLTQELARLEENLPFLASVAATAPFVGLFGTVWGIMNSFAGIAASKQTQLAVVAPGIAEALFATAIGLVVAIPATLAYNKFVTDLGKYAGRLEWFSGEIVMSMTGVQADEGGAR